MSGVLVKIMAAEGDTVPVDTALAVIDRLYSAVMPRLRILVTLAAILFCALRPAYAQDKSTVVPATLYILIDGLRYDLVTEKDAPYLARLAATGVRGEMIPSWPTISSPNHWALATGLTPIHSGVIHNEMFDPATKQVVTWENQSGWHGEPIWAAVARQGGLSGLIGTWVGGANRPPGLQPSFSIPYDARCPNCGALALALLDQRYEMRPRLLGLYTAYPDITHHKYGIGSPEALKELARIDAMIGEITSGLAARKLTDQVNIVIVGDHGQVVVPPDHQIEMQSFIDEEDLQAPPITVGPIGHLWPKPGLEDKVYARLRKAHPRIRVMRPAEIPTRLRCCDPRTVPPITLETEPGWAMIYKGDGNDLVGHHGYDNQLREMHPIFVAAGPSIRRGVPLKPFANVDVYPLIAHLTGVEPAASDGSIMSLCSILVAPPRECVR